MQHLHHQGKPLQAWTFEYAGGDPANFAAALVTLTESAAPPVRFAAGADAVGVFEAKADALRAQADAHRALSSSLAIGD